MNVNDTSTVFEGPYLQNVTLWCTAPLNLLQYTKDLHIDVRRQLLLERQNIDLPSDAMTQDDFVRVNCSRLGV